MRAIREHNRRFALHEIQRCFLEAFFRQIRKVAFRQRAKAVLVAAPVVVSDAPSNFGCAANLVRRWSVVWERLQNRGANVTVLRVFSLGVVPSFRATLARV